MSITISFKKNTKSFSAMRPGDLFIYDKSVFLTTNMCDGSYNIGENRIIVRLSSCSAANQFTGDAGVAHNFGIKKDTLVCPISNAFLELDGAIQ